MESKSNEQLFRYQWIGWLITVLLIVGAAFAGVKLPPLPVVPGGGQEPLAPAGAGSVTNFTGLAVAVPTTVATATPGVVVDSAAVSNIFEIRDAATPVAYVADGGAMTLANGLTVTAGGVTLSDSDLVVADDLRITAQTAITVTDGAAFTPTGTYQGIQAAGEVTPTITAGAPAGDLAVLINTSAQTINLADSGTLKLTAAYAMGQYDALVLWSEGTNWIEISRANN